MCNLKGTLHFGSRTIPCYEALTRKHLLHNIARDWKSFITRSSINVCESPPVIELGSAGPTSRFVFLYIAFFSLQNHNFRLMSQIVTTCHFPSHQPHIYTSHPLHTTTVTADRGRARCWCTLIAPTHSTSCTSRHLHIVNQSTSPSCSTNARCKEKPRSIIVLPLVRSEQDVYLVQKKNGHGKVDRNLWAATLMVGKVKGYRFQRYLGKVKCLYVFENPPL
jgi:hypothetical protein